jgi:hypothetical protein
LSKFVPGAALDGAKLRRRYAHLAANLLGRLFLTIEPNQDLSILRGQRVKNPVRFRAISPGHYARAGVGSQKVRRRSDGLLHYHLHKRGKTFRLTYFSILNGLNHFREHYVRQVLRAIPAKVAGQQILDTPQEVDMKLMDGILAPPFNSLYQESEKRS